MFMIKCTKNNRTVTFCVTDIKMFAKVSGCIERNHLWPNGFPDITLPKH